MFHSILDILSTKNGYQKNTKNRTSRPPLPYLGYSPKFYQFFWRLPKYTLQKNHLFLVKQCAKMIRQHKSRISTSISKKVISYENDKLIIPYNNLQNKKCQKNVDLYDNFNKKTLA